MGITEPVNASWWYAIADEACNGAPPTNPFTWNLNTTLWNAEVRTWSLT